MEVGGGTGQHCQVGLSLFPSQTTTTYLLQVHCSRKVQLRAVLPTARLFRYLRGRTPAHRISLRSPRLASLERPRSENLFVYYPLSSPVAALAAAKVIEWTDGRLERNRCPVVSCCCGAAFRWNGRVAVDRRRRRRPLCG